MEYFDFTKPTEAEQKEMVQGYLDGHGGKRLCQSDQPAYLHGFRNGRNDRLGKIDAWQRANMFMLEQAARVKKVMAELEAEKLK